MDALLAYSIAGIMPARDELLCARDGGAPAAVAEGPELLAGAGRCNPEPMMPF
jgi:hypothetical protein